MSSSIDKLRKILTLEADRDYDNRAIVGGLEKILLPWQDEARNENIEDSVIESISAKLNRYHTYQTEGRQKTIKELLEIIDMIQSNQSNKHRREKRSPRRDRKQNTTPRKQRTINTRSYQKRKSSIPSVPKTVSLTSENPATEIALNSPLTVINGIGPASVEKLAKLGLHTLGDLFYYFPRRYDDYSKLKPIKFISYGEELTVIGTVQNIQTRPIKGGRKQITEAVVSDDTGFLRVNWFNNPWIAKQLSAGDHIVLSGKVDLYLGRLVMTHPDWEPLTEEQLHTNRIVPVYSLTAGISQRELRRMIYSAISQWAPRIIDFLPNNIYQSADLFELAEAIYQIHFPDSSKHIISARERLAFDEIFLLQLGMLNQKSEWQSVETRPFEVEDDWFQQQIDNLPFALTNAQHKVLSEIRKDLATIQPMNRLLQGDVGAGKTVIAGLAVSILAKHNVQSALMAPTSILAEQHFHNLQKMLAGSDQSHIEPSQIRLLIGSTPESEKQQIREDLQNGSIRLLIGTHALIEDPVIFNDLHLVIIDEQHRFGVAQRAALRSKGNNPHLLVMTATPIPRSMALTLYGDLDISILDELPPGRQPIDTNIFFPRERERCYHFIKTQIKAGYQTFIIYPLVEKTTDTDDDIEDENKAAVNEHQRLQSDVFAHYRVGLLHGRMKPDEKNQVMSKFRDKEYDILVATSVVEVGVDIPNANTIVIEGANRFGLAQLHQFRGRVGRGQAKSYCILIPEKPDQTENERLSAMAETNDGFILAEKDLEQRGPGDFLGTRQAGFSELKIARLTDLPLIEKARNHAKTIFENDPNLSHPSCELLKQKLDSFWINGQGDQS